MGTTRNILNNSKIIPIEVDKKDNWIYLDTHEYHYFDDKVAQVSFNGSKCEVEIQETFAPWAYVSNNSGEYFVKISRVEDQIHGVNIIEMDNLQALFIERECNLNLKRGKEILIDSGFTSGNITPGGFATAFQNNINNAIGSMSKFSMWNGKGNKLTGIK